MLVKLIVNELHREKEVTNFDVQKLETNNQTPKSTKSDRGAES